MSLPPRSRLAAAVLAAAVVSASGIAAAPALAAPATSFSGVRLAAAVTVGDTLEPGTALHVDEQLASANGQYRLVMQGDGNVVLYSASGGVEWTTGTRGSGNYFTLQNDGNIVVYTEGGAPLWASDSSGHEQPDRLVLQDDGNLVSYARFDGGGPLWSSRGADTLGSDRRLERGQSITSQNGAYRTVFQRDGNLVTYGPNGVRWNAETSGGLRLLMQADGNLVIDDFYRPLWFTGTGGNAGARLIIQNDGNLVIYSTAGRALWSSDAAAPAPAKRDTLTAGQELAVGEQLTSADERFRAVLQGDGNFVLYDMVVSTIDDSGVRRDKVIWSSGTSGAGNRLVQQTDGNVVIYSAGGRALWQTGTSGNPGARFVLQNDANLVVYSASGRALWTYQQPRTFYFTPVRPGS